MWVAKDTGKLTATARYFWLQLPDYFCFQTVGYFCFWGPYFLAPPLLWNRIMLSWTDVVSNSSNSFPLQPFIRKNKCTIQQQGYLESESWKKSSRIQNSQYLFHLQSQLKKMWQKSNSYMSRPTIFFGMCFSIGFMVRFPWLQVWTMILL